MNFWINIPVLTDFSLQTPKLSWPVHVFCTYVTHINDSNNVHASCVYVSIYLSIYLCVYTHTHTDLHLHRTACMLDLYRPTSVATVICNLTTTLLFSSVILEKFPVIVWSRPRMPSFAPSPSVLLTVLLQCESWADLLTVSIKKKVNKHTSKLLW